MRPIELIVPPRVDGDKYGIGIIHRRSCVSLSNISDSHEFVILQYSGPSPAPADYRHDNEHGGHTRILYGRKGGQKEPHKACLALQETCSDPFNAFSPIRGVPCLVRLFLTAFSPVENTGLPAVEYFRGLPPPGAHLASYLPETHNHVVQSACPPNGQEARHSDILYLFGAWNRPGLTCPRGTVEFHLSGASHVTRWSS